VNPCDKPISEQTISEAPSCAWSTVRDAVVAVVNHPGGATVTEWLITVLAGLTVLFFLGLLVPRRR
jgi:hypothetical protein